MKVIILRTFYIFNLNKNYIGLATSEPNKIYIILKSIYSYNDKNIAIPFNLFKEVCNSINVEFFNKYFYDKLVNDEDYTVFKNIHMYHNYFTNEESKMNIFKSHIKIKSNKEDNIFLLNIKDITNLFVCDFINEYYNYFSSNSYKK